MMHRFFQVIWSCLFMLLLSYNVKVNLMPVCPPYSKLQGLECYCKLDTIEIFSGDSFKSCIPCLPTCPSDQAQSLPCNTRFNKTEELKCVVSPKIGSYFIKHNEWRKCRPPCNTAYEAEAMQCTLKNDRLCSCKQGYYRDTATSICNKRCSFCGTTRKEDHVGDDNCIDMPSTHRCKQKMTTSTIYSSTDGRKDVSTTTVYSSSDSTTIANTTTAKPSSSILPTNYTNSELEDGGTRVWTYIRWILVGFFVGLLPFGTILFFWKVIQQRCSSPRSSEDGDSNVTDRSFLMNPINIPPHVTLTSQIGDPENFPFAFKDKIIAQFGNDRDALQKAKVFAGSLCPDTASTFVNLVNDFSGALENVITRKPETTFQDLVEHLSCKAVGRNGVANIIKNAFLQQHI